MKKPEQIVDAIIKQASPIKVMKGAASKGAVSPVPYTFDKEHDVMKNIGGQPLQSKPFMPAVKAVEAPLTPHEALGHKPGKQAEAQLLEVSPGVYDIIFTCSCGAKSVIRCHSLDKNPA